MNLRVQLFAAVRDAAGTPVLEVPYTPGMTVADLRRLLVERLPALTALAPYLHFAIHADYAADGTVIPPDADVACIPPTSGG
ncbi:MAG: MoaD/ThiS family protein [Pirellulales bacterium]|nr:MoaD/ThiS family protein [Pirellulales bacterium]